MAFSASHGDGRCVRVLAVDEDTVAVIGTILKLAAWFRVWFSRPAPVPAPVHDNSDGFSKAPGQHGSLPAPDPAPVQRLKARPPAAEQAQALLEFLHREYAGAKVGAADVKAISYPQLVAAMGWRPRPWDGTDGVGHHLAMLTGGRTFAWFDVDGERKRLRAYQIPFAIMLTAKRV